MSLIGIKMFETLLFIGTLIGGGISFGVFTTWFFMLYEIKIVKKG